MSTPLIRSREILLMRNVCKSVITLWIQYKVCSVSEKMYKRYQRDGDRAHALEDYDPEKETMQVSLRLSP